MNSNLLVNGKEAFPLIINRIQNAKEEIIISMFIWRDDSIGNKIAEEVINAAGRGVRVSITKDKVGSIFEKEEENKESFFHKHFDIRTYLSQKILSFLYFGYLDEGTNKLENPKLLQMLTHPRISLNIDKLRYDHSKYYLIDSKYLILGGINIEDKELLYDKKNRKYSDYMVETTSENDIVQFQDMVVNRKHGNYSSLKTFYVDNRDLKVFEIKEKLFELFDRAKTSIDIEMAYWGDNDITNKVIEAANKGIALSIITSRDANLQNDYNMKVMSSILKRTNNAVKVYLSKRMVHSKLLCIDKSSLFLGSANFNSQGMKKVSELNVLIENDMEIIKKWLAARTEHLKECSSIIDYRELRYNKVFSFLERIYC